MTGLKLPFWGLSFVEFWCWGLIFGGRGGGARAPPGLVYFMYFFYFRRQIFLPERRKFTTKLRIYVQKPSLEDQNGTTNFRPLWRKTRGTCNYCYIFQIGTKNLSGSTSIFLHAAHVLNYGFLFFLFYSCNVGVFFCGPKVLSDQLSTMCNKHSKNDKKTTFFFNKENF